MIEYIAACSDSEKELMKKWGYSVLVNTNHCNKYLFEHNNDCTGCLSSLCCVKLVCISLNTSFFIGGLIKEEEFKNNIDLIQHLQTAEDVKRFMVNNFSERSKNEKI